MEKIRLGISSCLLGENVRYNGGHALDRFLRDTLGRYVEYVPVCPEVECGLGIPRESMHLQGDPEAPRLITTRTGRDLTDQMLTWKKNNDERVRRKIVKIHNKYYDVTKSIRIYAHCNCGSRSVSADQVPTRMYEVMPS